MKEHLLKCLQQKSTSDIQASFSISEDVVPMPFSNVLVPVSKKTQKRKTKQPTLDSFIPTMKKEVKGSTDRLLGKFLFSSDCSFRLVSNPFFQEFVQHLNPSYQLPDRETLGNTILDDVFSEVTTEMMTSLRGTEFVLLQDGYSTVQNEPLIAHCLSNSKTTIFFNVVQPKTEHKTAEYCFTQAKEAINDAVQKFGCEIIGVVTDNASAMKAMQQKVKEEFPDMEAYGCNAHLFNLLGREFTSKDIMKKVMIVHNYFRNHHVPAMTLKELGGKRPPLQGPTRWNGDLDALESYIENCPAFVNTLRQVTPESSDDIRKYEEVRGIVTDDNFYRAVQALIGTLKPIAIALDKVSLKYPLILP